MNFLRRMLRLLAIVACLGEIAVCPAQSNVKLGSLTDLRTDSGRLSFGNIVSADIVSWSAPDAQDLLIARLWDGVYLYPSKDLQAIGDLFRCATNWGMS